MQLHEKAQIAVIGAGPFRPGRRKARTRGGVRRDGVRGERRARRAVAHDGPPQRRVAGNAHQHEPRHDSVLGPLRPRRPAAPPGCRADTRLPGRLRAGVRGRRPHPLRCSRRGRAAGLDRRRRAVRCRRRRVWSLPQAAAPGPRRRLPRRAAPRVRVSRARAVPRPRDARLRQRCQRLGDRLRSRAARPGDLRFPQAAVCDREGGRRRLLGLAVVHAVRSARAAVF